MTYTFKLARRLAVSRGWRMKAALFLLAAMLLPDLAIGGLFPHALGWIITAPFFGAILLTRSSPNSTRRLTARRASDIFHAESEAPGAAAAHILRIRSRSVERTECEAKERRRQGILFLVAGVVTAIIGIVVYYLMLSNTTAGGPPGSDLIRAVGRAGLLGAIEALAWFFFAQYRVCDQDYKRLQRERRELEDDFLLHVCLAEEPETLRRLVIAHAILSKDLSRTDGSSSSVTAPGDTPDADGNPVFALLRTAIERWTPK